MPSEQYRIGLISQVTNASQVLIGTASCDWRGNVAAGHTFKVNRDGEATIVLGTVLTATRILLAANYTGTSGTGLSYIINRSFTSNRNYWRILQGDADFAEILSQDTIDKIDTDINNIITGNASIDGTTKKVFKINSNASTVRLNASWLTASRDYTFPNQNATLAGLGVAQTFSANQVIDASLWVKGNASFDGNLVVGGEAKITSSIVGQANASIDGNLSVGGNIAGSTYGSDSSVSDAELLYIGTLSSNAQTQLTTHTTNITRANASIDALQLNMINANASISAIDVTSINASITSLKSNVVDINASIAYLKEEFVPVEWGKNASWPPAAAEDIMQSYQTVVVRKFAGATTDEKLSFILRAPRGIQSTTVQYSPHVIITGTVPSSQGVVFGLKGHSKAVGASYGSEVLASKINLTGTLNPKYSQLQVGWSSAVTVASLEGGRLAFFEFIRRQSNADDDYATDIGVPGFDIRWI